MRVLLADDHQITREGLAALIDKEPDLEVVGQAGTGREAIDLAGELQPDVVVMDISMPDLNGIDATREIVRRQPAIRVVGLSMYSDSRYAASLFAAGGAGYVLKKRAFRDLAEALRTAANGQRYVSPELGGDVMREYVERINGAEAAAFSLLTMREREVLQLVAEGRTNREIAAGLHISVKTVDTHRRHIMEKLDLHTVAELTKYAVRHGLTDAQR